MLARLAVLALAVVLSAPAQMKMTVNQLVSFIQSSIKLRHDDRKVAAYLKNIRLTERLDDRTIEDLQGQGAGSKTIEALQVLRDASQVMPPPKPPEVKPPPPPIPPPSTQEQKKVIEEARDYALNYTKRLPDFICTQVARRFLDPSGLEFWQRIDIITAKLTFFEQKEDYKVVMVNSQPIDIPYERLSGAISSGEFGTMMKALFEPETKAEFTWTRWTTLFGRRHHVYNYRVAQSRSQWKISYQRSLEIISGYHGLVFVDDGTHSVSRIRLDADSIPPSFPIQQASIELDYDLVAIGNSQFMLPLRHTMRMREGKLLAKNEVQFLMYRKFGAEATITFDTPDALPEDKFKEGPPK